MKILADILARAAPANRLLVSHIVDAGLLGSLHGQYSNTWQRTAGQGKATAWPDGDHFYDEILLPLPRGKESLYFCLQACATVLKPDGKLWLFGLNELGIKSANKPLADFFEVVESVATGGHGRVWRAHGLKKTSLKTLAELRQTEVITLVDTPQQMANYPGLFAGGKLDEGTKLLLENLPVEIGTNVLDYACGIGVLARTVQLKKSVANITLADYDPLALLAAQENVTGSHQLLTARPSDLAGLYDTIISNPPIHIGNAQSYAIVDELLAKMPRLLRPKGSAHIVVQVTVPVPRLAAAYKLKCAEIATSRSFRVYCLTTGPTRFST